MTAADEQPVLSAMLDLAEEVSLPVRRVAAGGDGEQGGGAVVRLKGREMVFLYASATPAEQIAVLARALAGRKELEDRFLPPAVRDVIDRAGKEPPP